MAGDGEGEVVAPGLLCRSRVQLPTELEPAQHGHHLDVEEVRGVQLTGQPFEQFGVGLPADQGVDHRGGVDHDHRRSACIASTISSGVGPAERSRVRSLAAICAFVGLAAILVSSEATYADKDLPSAAARCLSVMALAEALAAPLYTCDARLARGGHDAEVHVVPRTL